ncbi:MAG: hypothetical protein U0559_05170 [Anaerolineae bacterium]
MRRRIGSAAWNEAIETYLSCWPRSCRTSPRNWRSVAGLFDPSTNVAADADPAAAAEDLITLVVQINGGA